MDFIFFSMMFHLSMDRTWKFRRDEGIGNSSFSFWRNLSVSYDFRRKTQKVFSAVAGMRVYCMSQIGISHTGVSVVVVGLDKFYVK